MQLHFINFYNTNTCINISRETVSAWQEECSSRKYLISLYCKLVGKFVSWVSTSRGLWCQFVLGSWNWLNQYEFGLTFLHFEFSILYLNSQCGKVKPRLDFHWQELTVCKGSLMTICTFLCVSYSLCNSNLNVKC